MPFMTHSTDNRFIDIENAAHSGAFGANSIPEPTEAQRKSGNYRMGRVSYQGLAIAIEQPRGTYRTGIDSETGKRWTSRMAAHYGYISQTKGNDGDGVDCFLGPFLESETAYVINQFIDGRFDEHKTMLGFPNEESARNSYLGSYECGWNGMESIVPLSISQFKWWLKNGDMSQPLRARTLPQEGLEAMTKRVQWNSDAMPYDYTLDQILYEIRQSDSGENLLLDSISINDIIEDSDGVLALDALVTPFVRLERKMELLRGVMERAGKSVKVESMQISDPFSQRGTANVAVIFELSDGQTVSIYFHNPDVTPKKMAPTDEVISWKWLLNKKDITIVVAPERGQDLNVREVARRIMRLAEKNSPAFARANAKRSERMQNIQSLKDEIVTLEGELKSAQNELEIAKVAAEGRTPAVEPTPTEDGDNSNNPALPQTDFHVDITSLIEALPGLDGFGISSLTIRTNGEISAVSNNNIKNSGVTDADILAAYGKGLLRKASGSSEVDPIPAGSDENGDSQAVTSEEHANLIKAAALWKGATMKVAGILEGDKGASLQLSRMTTKSDLDAYLMRKFGIDETTARDISNTLTAQNIPADMSADLDDYKGEGWHDLIAMSGNQINKEVEAAKAFLKSVVEGTSNASDLMKLLDEIEASAQALIDAGLSAENDELIGGAAEKWAELDQQANG